MRALEVVGLAVDRSGTPVLEGLDLDAADQGITAVLGPSGCGKTTLLRAIAGFERPRAGSIRVRGREVAGPTTFVPPEQRRLGMVFQEGALFPHLDAAHNVAYGLRAKATDPRVGAALELVGLGWCASRRPESLSGGEQQRLALARALAPQPELVLLDEPFANLDAELRQRLREELLGILAAAQATAVLVTHDQEEALSLASRVAVLLDGKICQLGPPEEIYLRPTSAAVARFVGDGQLVECEIEGGIATTGLGRLAAAGPGRGRALALIRPEVLRLVPETGAERRGTLVRRRFFGHDAIEQVRFDDGSTVEIRRLAGRPGPAVGTRVGVELAVDEVWTVCAD